MSSCFMISKTLLAVVYCCPLEILGAHHFQYASRFVSTLAKFEPGHPYQLIVVSNGGQPSEQVCQLFGDFNPKFIVHSDAGYDIGAYQAAAQQVECDLMVFLGGSTYIRGAGWAKRIVESYEKHGQQLYGTMANTGDERFAVHAHIRTTGFWIPPALFNQHPTKVNSPDQRYPFEHGYNCLTQWIVRQNKRALIVTWDNEYDLPLWGAIPNGFHQGDQGGMLFGDRLSEPPFFSPP